MSEAWMQELLGSMRDMARAQSMYRLAEHLDDAILLAASEFHEAQNACEGGLRNVGSDRAVVRGDHSGCVH
jgi:hypothetical protein